MARTLQSQIGWSNRAQWTMAGLTVFSAAMFYLTWYRPATQYLDNLRSHVETRREELQAAQARASELPQLQADVVRLQARLEPFSHKLPKQLDLVPFMKDVGNACQRASIKKFNQIPGTERRFDSLVEKPVSMNFEGDFDSVINFFRQVEDMQRLTRVKSLTIKSKDAKTGQVEVQMAMNIYYAD